MGTLSSHEIMDLRTAWRTRALFKAMSGDYLLREQFATDPMRVFCDYAFADLPLDAEVQAANQLIFAAVSSPSLRRWMGAFARQHGGKPSGRHRFAVEFASAIAVSRDPLVVLGLVRAAAGDRELFRRQADFFRGVLVAMGSGDIAGGTEMSPGGGTEMSPGGGTEMSPGAARLSEQIATEVRIAARLASSILSAAASGTEMSPGGGTEMSPGGGTEMSPGALRLAEALAASLRRAELFSREFLRASGTEMSPGGGTEMSPGGGTEMSPGMAGFGVAERLAAELASAARFAAEFGRLEAAGTEMSPGGTEMSPGGGTEMSPGALRLAEALGAALQRAERFSAQLTLAGQGTEMSPGGGTEMSPGRGTEMSEGQWGIQLPGYVAASLGSVVQYATELRRRGALSTSGLEVG
jgi:hypothetical protein